MDQNYRQIRSIRKQKQLTLKELSKITGIPFQKLSCFENGQIVPTAERIKIEQALGIDFSLNTETDRIILELFDEFFDAIFYGNLNTKFLHEKVEHLFESSLDSKNYYLVYVMNYIFKVLDGEDDFIDEWPTRSIDFDTTASTLYQIYKAVSLYEKGDLANAKELLSAIIDETSDAKMRCLAQYQLVFVLIDKYNLDYALKTLERARLGFLVYGAFIRILQCNLHQANIYGCQHRYTYAIEKYEQSIKSAISLNLPVSQIAFIYRNIAMFNIYNHSFDLALTPLNKAYSLEPKNERIILYYLYYYYFTSDLKQFNSWLNKAKHNVSNRPFTADLDFWIIVGKHDFKPTTKVIERAIKVYQYFVKIKYYEKMYFYLDIIISLYDQIGDDKNKCFYLEKQKEMLIFIYNS